MRKIWLIDKVGMAWIDTHEWSIPIHVSVCKYSGFIKRTTEITIGFLCFYIKIETKTKYNKDCEVIE